MGSYAMVRRRSVTKAYLLWLLGFFGLAGLHRLYTGRLWTGLLWFFTGGLFLIGQIVDFFLIPGQCDEPQ